MFPKILDGAEVLYYTPYDNFGEIYWDNGEIGKCLCCIMVVALKKFAIFSIIT